MDFFKELKIKNVNSDTKKIALMLRACILEINNANYERTIAELCLIADDKKLHFNPRYGENNYSANKPIWNEGHEIFSILNELETSKDISFSLWNCDYECTDWLTYFEQNMTDELRKYVSYKQIVIDSNYDSVYGSVYDEEHNGEISLSEGFNDVADIDCWFSSYVTLCVTDNKETSFNEDSLILKKIEEATADWCEQFQFEISHELNVIFIDGGQSICNGAIVDMITGMQKIFDIATEEGLQFSIEHAEFGSASLDVFAILKFSIKDNKVIAESCRF